MPAPTVVELLWGTGRQAKRGPKPSLSLEAIVGAAIELADAEGLAGVSMQRVAERLGYTKMSLYRYVPGKAELAALMLEQAIGAPPDIAVASPDSAVAPPGSGAASLEGAAAPPDIATVLPGSAAVSPGGAAVSPGGAAGSPGGAAGSPGGAAGSPGGAAGSPGGAARSPGGAAVSSGSAAASLDGPAASPDIAGAPPHSTAASLDSVVAQAVSGEPPWRAGLRRWTEEIFRRYRAHPWALELSTGIRPMGPNELGWLEAALSAMAGIGLTGPERLDTVVVLNGHVRSLALQNAGAPADGMEEQLMRQMAEVMQAAGDRYPEVTAAMSEQAGGSSARDDALNFGIDRILDGLQALIDGRANRAPGRTT